MKVVAQRGDEYLIVPDDAEPGENVDGVITNGESVDTINAPSALARGYWEEPSSDVTADELLPESFDTASLTDDPDESGEDSKAVRIKGLTKEALDAIERKYNAVIEDGS